LLLLSGEPANSWIVGNPSLTGLRKGCPSLVQSVGIPTADLVIETEGDNAGVICEGVNHLPGSSIKEEVKKKISPGAGSFLASQPM
jgi:hypothetical protein